MKVSQRGRSLLRPAAATGLVLVGLFAMPLSSEAKTVVATDSGSLDHEGLTATATCPKGSRAVGGGFATSPPTTSTPSAPPRTEPTSKLAFIQVYESQKVKQNAWKVSGEITDSGGTGAPRTLEAYAYCKNLFEAPKTEKVSEAGVSPAFQAPGDLVAWTADAQCPQGKRPTAGGFQTDVPYKGVDDPRITVGVSKLTAFSANAATGVKEGHSLTIFTAHPGTAFTSFVYCADKGAQVKHGARDAVGQGTLLTAFSGECKKKKRPRAGGFDQPNASPLTSDAPKGYYDPILGSLRIGKQWWVTALHNGQASTTLRSVGYCS
jgi:hypothetical protein